MKKAGVILALLMAFLVVGCGSSKGGKADTTGNGGTDKKKVVTVTTSFLQDMVHQLAKDDVDVKLIIPAGEDPHLYLAKPEDMKKIQEADLLLYHGLHFEGKMIDILEKRGVAVSKNFPKDKIGEMDEDGVKTVDPHFWFDIDLYQDAVKVASEELQKLLPEKKDAIEGNTKDYLKQLDDLKVELREKLETIPKDHRYLITPHDAFNYFSRYFGIEVHAPQGVSTDSEIATGDIDETVDFIVKHHIKAVFAESTTDPARMVKLQETVRRKGEEVKVVSGEGKELFSDSLAPKGQEGDNYIDMYRHNVDLMVEYLK